MSETTHNLGQSIRRVLDVLTRDGGQAVPGADGSLMLRHVRGGITLGAGESNIPDADDLVQAGLAAWQACEGYHCERLVATTRGHSVQAGTMSDAPSPYTAARLPLKRMQIDGPDGTTSVMVDMAESPLAWLRRRKGKDGRTLISDSAFQAGERLRRDLTLAGNLPGVTMDWSRPFIDGSGPGDTRGLNVTETVIAARQRVTLALNAVGQDLSGLLVDLCGFLKPLGQIEAERGWPVRSGKVMVGLALDRLAGHYGLTTLARGPERSRRIRQWGTPDRRPAINPA